MTTFLAPTLYTNRMMILKDVTYPSDAWVSSAVASLDLNLARSSRVVIGRDKFRIILIVITITSHGHETVSIIHY